MEMEVREQFQLKISNRFATLESFLMAGIQVGLGNILQKTAKCHVKKVTAKTNGSSINHSSMKIFEICGSRKRAELQWLQDPSQINAI